MSFADYTKEEERLEKSLKDTISMELVLANGEDLLVNPNYREEQARIEKAYEFGRTLGLALEDKKWVTEKIKDVNLDILYNEFVLVDESELSTFVFYVKIKKEHTQVYSDIIVENLHPQSSCVYDKGQDEYLTVTIVW